jgi:hypothetical protein
MRRTPLLKTTGRNRLPASAGVPPAPRISEERETMRVPRIATVGILALALVALGALPATVLAPAVGDRGVGPDGRDRGRLQRP